MITASEALRLPSAQLTEDDKGIVAKLLREIETGIQTSMKRNGFEFQTNNTNPAAMFEVVVILQEHGFTVQCQPLLNQPAIHGGRPTHVGYALQCAPSQASIEASRRTLQ